ncbi:acyltransferase family protein [Kocuria sp.]|uniref:acyltransferase family protein n=1 Tax=Kocuria sp. TaxID=1871328 RepID=UPI0026DF4D83|nr:acyltransferase family protein [Kocuria sp.]MDO5618942.1 acyltransferase family protein [Kocuria sp.]
MVRPGVGQGDQRDVAVDAARVAALAFVVCAHILLVTLMTDPVSGHVTNVMVPTQYPWFWWVTWMVQIMPLFFVVGGYASAVSWNRVTAKGGGGTGGAGETAWVAARVLKLAQPAALLWVFLAVVYLLARVAGAPPEYVDAALPGIGMHLWFLGAYTLCVMAVPFTVAAHRSRPLLTLGLLVAAGAAVEVLRIALDEPWWGLLGLAPIWLAIHQLGYFRADGAFARCPLWGLLLLAAASYAGLAVLTSFPAWSRDMLTNLNPPTLTLFLLGLGQACLLQVLTPALRAVMTLRPAQGSAWLIGARPVSLYLWHLPVIVCVTAVWWLLDGPQPAVPSAAWWWWRVPIAGICWLAVLLVVRLVGPVEATAVLPAGHTTPRSWSAVLLAAGLVVIPAVLEIRYLLTPWLVVGGAVSYVGAVVVLRAPWRAVAISWRARWRGATDVG